jgi:S-adenosylmethionine-dependent methyltransferase
VTERDEIENYYNRGVQNEWTRMDRRPIEFELTKLHIESLLIPKSRIADVGSGPGRYAIHFAKRGHKLSIVDLSKMNIERAKMEAVAQGVTFENCFHLSATKLNGLATETYDAVLCLGPLYHLTSERDRCKAINECTRILKPYGILFAAFVSPYAHALSIIARNKLEKITSVVDEFEYILKNGRNHNPELLDFTHAWYPVPSEIRNFMERFGLKTEKIACLEPLGWVNSDGIQKLSEIERAAWYKYLCKISTDPSIIGASQHILYCGRKE